MTRPEYASFRMNPAYRQWEEEKMDIYSGPDAVSKVMSLVLSFFPSFLVLTSHC